MSTKHSDTKNLLIALVLSIAIMVYWQFFIEAPRQKQEAMAQRMQAQSEPAQRQEESAEQPKPREALIAESPRVRIKSPELHGSIALKGLRFDDLTLAQYHETLDAGSPEVTLFSPPKSKDSYYAEIGWLPGEHSPPMTLPDKDSLWGADNGELSPGHPVTFTWNNGTGAVFTIKISLDEKYLFTLDSNVNDATGRPLTFFNYALINRVYDVKAHQQISILHEGPLGVFDGILHEAPYKKLNEQKKQVFEAKNGWLGITDKYWLAAILPPEEPFSSELSFYERNTRQHFQAEYHSPAKVQQRIRLFAGAKEMDLLDYYEDTYHIPLFDHAVDLGLFDFLTKPILRMLTYFYGITGNFGIAILLLTVIVKLLMFPMASKSFRSMNQMKDLQPKMNDLRERYKDDKLKLNQEIMELYKREKVNPASGCLPMFIQIPVFFSLYKVLYVTLEMRHAPFFGWIHDLSAPDPTNLFTLFGLVPWSPPTIMHLGIWPIIMCVTMIIQQHQSPPPADPAQAKMMKLLPLFFLFLFSSFASGLVIYWSWSNILTIMQQWYIKKKYAK